MFYCGVLGLDVTRRRTGATFLSSGGYHHRLAVNVWHSNGAGIRNGKRASLDWFAMEINDQPTIDGVKKSALGQKHSQFDDQSDAAIKKAKATITAKMGNPASVEFVEIKRAAATDTLGNSNDFVCGFVREKNTGPRPFLYFVPKGEAYIGGYNIATSAYRHICSITL